MVSLIIDHIDIWTSAQTQKTNGAGRGNGSANHRQHGIKKLRELILELAVRGRLVPQDPSDEPASVLLKKISAEKARLIKEGKIKIQEPLSEIGEDEKPFGLPIGWVWTRLGNISVINPRNEAEDESRVSFVPMSLITASYTGEHGQEDGIWGTLKQGYTHFANGDIGIAKITPCFENSKAVVFSNLKNGIGAGTTELHIARPFGKTLCARYILLYLKAPQFLLLGETKMTGTAGQKRVPKNFFAGNPLPLPPLAEQHRIVAKVDELMVLCGQLEQQQTASNAAHQILVEILLATLAGAADQDEFVEAWQHIASNFDTLFTTEQSIDQLKQTILQLAIMGKLVPQDPNDEPAGVLLEKISKEKKRLTKEGKIKEQKPLSEISKEEKPFELPEGWKWVHLGDISTLKGGFAYNSSDFSGYGKHQVIRMGNIRPNYLRLDENPACIPADLAEATSEYKIERNDILLTMTGTKGKRDYLYSLIVRPEHLEVRKLYLNQRLCIIRGLLLVYEFLNMIIKDNRLLDVIYSKSTGTANQANIGITSINNWVLPLPPIKEQQRIVTRVDELIAMCDSLKAQLQETQTTQVQLVDAIVEQAVG